MINPKSTLAKLLKIFDKDLKAINHFMKGFIILKKTFKENIFIFLMDMYLFFFSFLFIENKNVYRNEEIIFTITE
jgi:hypothetical protein